MAQLVRPAALAMKSSVVFAQRLVVRLLEVMALPVVVVVEVPLARLLVSFQTQAVRLGQCWQLSWVL